MLAHSQGQILLVRWLCSYSQKIASILFMLSYTFNTNKRLNIIKPSYQESWSPAYSQQWKQPHKKGLVLKWFKNEQVWQKNKWHEILYKRKLS